MLGLQPLSQVLFFTLFITLITLDVNTEIVFTVFAIRTIIYTVTIAMASSKLKEKDLIILVPFLEIILIILQVIIFISNKIIYPKRWH